MDLKFLCPQCGKETVVSDIKFPPGVVERTVSHKCTACSYEFDVLLVDWEKIPQGQNPRKNITKEDKEKEENTSGDNVSNKTSVSANQVPAASVAKPDDPNPKPVSQEVVPVWSGGAKDEKSASNPSGSSPHPPVGQALSLQQQSHEDTVAKGKVKIAGILLIIATVLIVIQAVIMFASPFLFEEMDYSSAGNVDVSGRILDENNKAVEGANVTIRTIKGNYTSTTTTDSNGRFSFSAVPQGIVVITATHERYGKSTLKTLASPDSNEYDLTMNSDGSATEMDLIGTLKSVCSCCGVFLLLTAVFAGTGAFRAVKGDSGPLAITGAVAGLIGFGLLAGSILSIIALIFLLQAKKRAGHPVQRTQQN
ncbi:MAG: carboxypeptidase-like regulatory domain-containing protein [Thermoplasmata archaeon]